MDEWKMQKLVAGLLTAMELQTIEKGKGPDGGVDVVAYHDIFELEKPLIKVQVKHWKRKVSSRKVQ